MSHNRRRDTSTALAAQIDLDPDDPNARAAARLTVAANATDPSDAAHLLAVLGLDKEDQ